MANRQFCPEVVVHAIHSAPTEGVMHLFDQNWWFWLIFCGLLRKAELYRGEIYERRFKVSGELMTSFIDDPFLFWFEEFWKLFCVQFIIVCISSSEANFLHVKISLFRSNVTMTNLFLKGNLQRKKTIFFIWKIRKFSDFRDVISKIVLLFNLLIQANYLGKFR